MIDEKVFSTTITVLLAINVYLVIATGGLWLAEIVGLL